MSTKVKAVVIGSKDYKDKDRLITLFTLEEGKMTCSMKGVRGEKAKLKAAKEIFSFGEFIIENGKGYNIISQVEIIDPFFGICQNIDKYYEGCAILDIVGKVASESEPALFLELLKALKTLCYDSVPKFYILDKFLLHIFKMQGYELHAGGCSSCGMALNKKYFNLDSGEFVCPNCRNATCIAVSEACFSAMRILNEIEYDKLNSLTLGGNGERELYKLLESNFEWRTGNKFCSVPL